MLKLELSQLLSMSNRGYLYLLSFMKQLKNQSICHNGFQVPRH